MSAESVVYTAGRYIPEVKLDGIQHGMCNVIPDYQREIEQLKQKLAHKTTTVYTIVLQSSSRPQLTRCRSRNMILRDNAYSRSARDAFLDCIRAARVSSRALFIQLLVIIVIIGTIIAIIRKHRTATWIGI
jgi:hypothetical protein